MLGGPRDKPFGGTPPPFCSPVRARRITHGLCESMAQDGGDLRGTITRDDDIRVSQQADVTADYPLNVNEYEVNLIDWSL